MRILLVHNEYGRVSGEETVVRSIRELLEARGHDVRCYFRSSAEFSGKPLGVAKSFFTGIYNPSSRRAMREFFDSERPDVVHVHNLFPLISPSILAECKRAGVPVVMTVHNYRLVCPTGLHLLNGKVCEKCNGGREYHCVLNRCEDSFAKSAGYALRNAVARKMRFFKDNVTLYATLTEFQRGRLIDAGYPVERIVVIPNMVDDALVPSAGELNDPGDGQYVGFVGRISPEKSISTLLAAARRLPHIQFKLAGSVERMPHLVEQAPANVQFLKHLDAVQLSDFYRCARMIVLCSICFEGFPTILPEAMLHGKPVVCSRIGGLPEIVDDGNTGVLFTPGNETEFTVAIQRLWDHPELGRQMGQAGREKAKAQYSRQRYYERLIQVYQRAVSLVPSPQH